MTGSVLDWFWNATGSTAAPKQVCQTDFALKRFAHLMGKIGALYFLFLSFASIK
jgi:hypothetical protein